MPKLKISINEEIKVNKFTANDIPRCVDCNLICSINLNYKGNYEPYILYECENGHTGNISLEEYIKKCYNFSISKEKCSNCGKAQKEDKADFFFCCTCKIFICNSCQIRHSEDRHLFTNIRRYDSLCTKHSNLYSAYCTKCKKNLCVYCLKSHRTHELINLSELFYSKVTKNVLLEEMNNIENRIKDLDKIKEKIVSEINKLKESTKLEMELINILIKTYDYEETQKNLNYNVILNMKKIDKIFKSNKIKIYERIYKDGNNYLNNLQNIKSIISEFQENYKTLKNHTNNVYYISKLSDGRLISSSKDNLLNIYKKDSYDLQVSIKEHTGAVYSFTELKDGRIISCSSDKTMKIIKLLEDDKYQVDQTLEGHKGEVYKAIEIKENELISISYDKTMKLWKLNKDNAFECILNAIFQYSNSYCNILKINEEQFVTSSCSDSCLKFWNANNYSNIETIKNISIEWTYDLMCLIDNDLLCVGGKDSKGFYLIKISSHQLIKNILGPKTIYSIVQCVDGLFLCSIINENGNYSLAKYEYDFENKNLKKVIEKEKPHDNGSIYAAIELNRRTIASCSSDYSIKLWEI